MKNKKIQVGTIIKLGITAFTFFVLSLFGGVPYAWSGLLALCIAIMCMALFTANIIWASRKNSWLLLLAMPFIYLFLQIMTHLLFAPTPYAIPGQ